MPFLLLNCFTFSHFRSHPPSLYFTINTPRRTGHLQDRRQCSSSIDLSVPTPLLPIVAHIPNLIICRSFLSSSPCSPPFFSLPLFPFPELFQAFFRRLGIDSFFIATLLDSCCCLLRIFSALRRPSFFISKERPFFATWITCSPFAVELPTKDPKQGYAVSNNVSVHLSPDIGGHACHMPFTLLRRHSPGSYAG